MVNWQNILTEMENHIKQKEKQPPWMYIAAQWLRKDIYNYNKDFQHLKSNNITKFSNIAPFYYHDLIYYIKTQNPKLPNQKNETKIVYKSILEEGIFGEKQWKDKITNLDFQKFGKAHIYLIVNPTSKIYYSNYYIMVFKQTPIFTKIVETKQICIQTVNTVTKWKTTFTS